MPTGPRRVNSGGRSRRKLKDVQYAFIEWLCDPMRNPPEQGQWAAANGVHEVTVSRWKRNPAFIEAWYDRLHELDVSPEKVQEVTVALQRKAADGDVKAAKLYLDYVSQFTPQREVVQESRQLKELSDEELDALIRGAAADELAARRDADSEPPTDPPVAVGDGTGGDEPPGSVLPEGPLNALDGVESAALLDSGLEPEPPTTPTV